MREKPLWRSKKTNIRTDREGTTRTTHWEETALPLLSPDECLSLPGIHKVKVGRETVVESGNGDMLIFTAGHPPIYGKQILHLQDPELLAERQCHR